MILTDIKYDQFSWKQMLNFALSHNLRTHSILGGQKAVVFAQSNWNKEC